MQLWGDDHALARAEVEALVGGVVVPVARGLVVCDGDDWRVLARLGLGRAVFELLGQSAESEPPFEPANVVIGSFGVRVQFVGDGVEGSVRTARELERRIGQAIVERLERPRVDLTSPETEIDVFVTQGAQFWGRLLWSADAKGFAEREPRGRPFWRSVALAPRKARCLVNLSRVQPGQALLDPFCGTGSISIEAASMGVRAVASDVDPVVVAGATRNFAALSLEEIDVLQMDARGWTETGRLFDAVVTDLPYGRSASIKGVDRDELYHGFVETVGRVLAPGGRAVVMAPEGTLPVGASALRVVGRFSEFVHGGLTREVSVMEKEG